MGHNNWFLHTPLYILYTALYAYFISLGLTHKRVIKLQLSTSLWTEAVKREENTSNRPGPQLSRQNLTRGNKSTAKKTNSSLLSHQAGS